MRKAVRVAVESGDEASRNKALICLASLGEVDEAAMSSCSEAYIALFRGMAALNQENPEEAMNVLARYRLELPFHAECLAEAQFQAGSADEAVKTLTDAIEHFHDHSLYDSLIRILFTQDRLEDAATKAKEALALQPAAPAQRELRKWLVRIAARRSDWSELEIHARIWAKDFPQDSEAYWQVVYALYCQAKNQQAHAYLDGRDLIPLNVEMGRLMVDVYAAVGVSERAANRLLEIAEMCPTSEQVSSAALGALLLQSERLGLSEQQYAQLSELLEDFTTRFPQSDVLRHYSAEELEDWLAAMTAGQQEAVEHYTPLLHQVRYGQMPYGALPRMCETSYPELLLSTAAGALTSIPADEDHHHRERRIVKQILGSGTLGGGVAVDTSVAALGVLTDLDVVRMGGVFESVLVADELTADARMAVVSAKRSVSGFVAYDPGFGHAVVRAIGEQQNVETQQKAERVLRVLQA